METKINIAKILKDKPVNTKLYSPLYGDVYFSYIGVRNNICVLHHRFTLSDFFYNGRYTAYKESEIMLFPSKDMRDWSKFAWKKGDILVNKDAEVHIIFDGFKDDTYKTFHGHYYLWEEEGSIVNFEENEDYMQTSEFYKANKEEAQTYINTIEERLGGKLNMETLEIEKAHPEFKDGDIVALVVRKCTHIAIFQSRQEAYIGFHAVLCQNDELLLEKPFREDVGDIELRLATDSEKQQLFDALAKEGKAWNAEKKQIVDIKKELQFKPFEKVLVRDSIDDVWIASFFSHIREDDGRYATTGLSWKFCIPYEGNEHLLGTTDNFE